MPSSDVTSVTLPVGLDRLGRAEIVVGIPSLNSARTIGHVVGAVAAGLAEHYPGTGCAILDVDGGSRDGTPEVARRATNGATPLLVVRHETRPVSRLATSYAGFPGRADALRAILRAAERLGARACALVDGDARGITPAWVSSLLDPVLHDAMDLVAPVYARHKYDGMITTNLLYPLTRALYGQRVRQAVGGHFGLSQRLAKRLVRSGVWDREAVPLALDVWMSTTAIADGLRVCQTRLGADRRTPRGAGDALEASFTQAVGTVFALMGEFRPAWSGVVATAEVPTYGAPLAVGLEPVSINVDRMISTFRQGAEALRPVWRRALGAEACAALEGLEDSGATGFRFPADVWAGIVYDCATAYHQRLLPRRHLLRAMIPLYLGRAAAFVLETNDGDAAAVEAEVEALCGVFETMKPHLLDRWDARRP